MTALVARARGLSARLLDEATLAEIERARDPRSLAAAFARAGLAEDASYAAVERATRQRSAADLAILARWSDDAPDACTVLELDEDRQTLRAIVRGAAAGVPAERRRLAATTTSRLSERRLAALVEASTVTDIAEQLAAIDHPLAAAFASFGDSATTDVLALEIALAKTFAAAARARATDAALRLYVAQTIDCQNASSAVLLAARGGTLPAHDMFVAGGGRLSRAAFASAAKHSLDDARAELAEDFAGTPLARALLSGGPAALDEAALDWHIATQRHLRRSEPHGLAAVIHVILCRRRETRLLRRAAWRLALGGAR